MELHVLEKLRKANYNEVQPRRIKLFILHTAFVALIGGAGGPHYRVKLNNNR
jgi:hypothetical protein